MRVSSWLNGSRLYNSCWRWTVSSLEHLLLQCSHAVTPQDISLKTAAATLHHPNRKVQPAHIPIEGPLGGSWPVADPVLWHRFCFRLEVSGITWWLLSLHCPQSWASWTAFLLQPGHGEDRTHLPRWTDWLWEHSASMPVFTPIVKGKAEEMNEGREENNGSLNKCGRGFENRCMRGLDHSQDPLEEKHE